MPLLLSRARPLGWRAPIAMFIVLISVFVVSPAFGEDDEERLEELKEERERIQEEAAAQALQVNAAEATFEELAQALDDINALVDLQQARLTDAEQAVNAAEAQVELAEFRQLEIDFEMSEIQARVSELAVAAFTGESAENGEDLTSFLLSDDPSEAVRRRSLVEFQTGNLGDALDDMRRLRAEADLLEEERREAVASAELNQQEVFERELELSEAKEAQLLIVIDAEARLEARLAEASFIAELDADKAAEIRRQEEVIASRIRAEAAREAARLAALRPPPPDRDDMVNAEGFIVHQDIADAVGRMIRAAREDGVVLTGYGYRSSQRTAELRVINGCPDVYDSSPSSCRIPTARPGSSMHEFGRAIDFRSCWRGSDCFTWLSRNANDYGLYNLPSESWHWSTNAR
ncbi:MAG: D-alanyl-D-alanine carboxypeptidase family protein [Acidimicrobiales bacterium]